MPNSPVRGAGGATQDYGRMTEEEFRKLGVAGYRDPQTGSWFGYPNDPGQGQQQPGSGDVPWGKGGGNPPGNPPPPPQPQPQPGGGQQQPPGAGFPGGGGNLGPATGMNNRRYNFDPSNPKHYPNPTLPPGPPGGGFPGGVLPGGAGFPGGGAHFNIPPPGFPPSGGPQSGGGGWGSQFGPPGQPAGPPFLPPPQSPGGLPPGMPPFDPTGAAMGGHPSHPGPPWQGLPQNQGGYSPNPPGSTPSAPPSIVPDREFRPDPISPGGTQEPPRTMPGIASLGPQTQPFPQTLAMGGGMKRQADGTQTVGGRMTQPSPMMGGPHQPSGNNGFGHLGSMKQAPRPFYANQNQTRRTGEVNRLN